MTVGAISAQMKMLKMLTAYEENIPMMEKVRDKFFFSVSELSVNKAGYTYQTDAELLNTYCSLEH